MADAPHQRAARRRQRRSEFLTSDDYRDFDDPSIDASIRFGNGSFGAAACDQLFHETSQLVTSPGFLAAHPDLDEARPTLTLATNHMLDHEDPHSNGWTTWTDYFRRDGQPPDIARRLRKVLSYPTMLDMVKAGEGVGVGFWGLEGHLITSGDLVRISAPIVRPDWGYYLVYNPDSLKNPDFAGMRDYLLNAT